MKFLNYIVILWVVILLGGLFLGDVFIGFLSLLQLFVIVFFIAYFYAQKVGGWRRYGEAILSWTKHLRYFLGLFIHIFFVVIIVPLPTRLLLSVKDHTAIILLWGCYIIWFLGFVYSRDWKETKTPKIFIVFFGVFLGAIVFNLSLLFDYRYTHGVENLKILVIRFYGIATLLYFFLLIRWHWSEVLMLKAYTYRLSPKDGLSFHYKVPPFKLYFIMGRRGFVAKHGTKENNKRINKRYFRLRFNFRAGILVGLLAAGPIVLLYLLLSEHNGKVRKTRRIKL